MADVMPAEQEMFCCALVKGNGPKVEWLHHTCHDYWDRLESAARDVERLEVGFGKATEQVVELRKFAHKLEEEARAATFEVERLRAALGLYAEPFNWFQTTGNVWAYDEKDQHVPWSMAQAALDSPKPV